MRRPYPQEFVRRRTARTWRKSCPSARSTSSQTVRSSLSAPKRSRCAEVLFLPKIYELPNAKKLPDSDIFTVGVKRFRYAQVLCQQAFSQRNPRHLVPEQHGMRRLHPLVFGRQCRVVKRNMFPEAIVTASAPSATNVKVVTPQTTSSSLSAPNTSATT